MGGSPTEPFLPVGTHIETTEINVTSTMFQLLPCRKKHSQPQRRASAVREKEIAENTRRKRNLTWTQGIQSVGQDKRRVSDQGLAVRIPKKRGTAFTEDKKWVESKWWGCVHTWDTEEPLVIYYCKINTWKGSSLKENLFPIYSLSLAA